MIIVLTILYPHATAWEFVGWFGCRRVSAWRQSSELELCRKARPPPGGGAFRPGRQVLHPVAGSPGRRRGSYGATDFAGGSDHRTGTAGARQDPFRREALATDRTRKRGRLAQMAAAPPGAAARKAGASTRGDGRGDEAKLRFGGTRPRRCGRNPGRRVCGPEGCLVPRDRVFAAGKQTIPWRIRHSCQATRAPSV